jgi:hypothetical protein
MKAKIKPKHTTKPRIQMDRGASEPVTEREKMQTVIRSILKTYRNTIDALN